jgi:toxin ParE1/3/4
MAPAEPGLYRLTPRALADLEDIWRHGVQTWSITQAERYLDSLLGTLSMIAAFPTLARERSELTPPVRIHPHEAHLIIYVMDGDHISILRLLGGRQDWRAVLNAVDH